jgi:hypothetical protein
MNVNGGIIKITNAPASAKTPPSLFGIDRRIAYSHRKYHSGWMWMGVTRGLAFRKFSGSVNKFGANKINTINRDRLIAYPSRSLME